MTISYNINAITPGRVWSDPGLLYLLPSVVVGGLARRGLLDGRVARLPAERRPAHLVLHAAVTSAVPEASPLFSPIAFFLKLVIVKFMSKIWTCSVKNVWLSWTCTEMWNIIPACLKLTASVQPGNLASPCTANQPISESLSFILWT